MGKDEECTDCKSTNRKEIHNYMVHKHVWDASGMSPQGGMLCIGCLENRIGRKLTKDDFHPQDVDRFNQYAPSSQKGNYTARLRNRLSSESDFAFKPKK